jgi:hypothetical protein
MSSLIKRIELIANVGIIVVAVLLGTVLVRSYLWPRSGWQKPNAAAIAAGTRLSLPGVDWKANGRTLLLALSTQCHFCTDSAPFYQRVAQERVKTENLRLIAILPQPVPESEKYLKELGMKVDDIKQMQLDSLGVNGTPTLILTNSEGVISDTWRGKLPSEKESEVLNRLR